jgi:hypothetical protein
MWRPLQPHPAYAGKITASPSCNGKFRIPQLHSGSPPLQAGNTLAESAADKLTSATHTNANPGLLHRAMSGRHNAP